VAISSINILAFEYSRALGNIQGRDKMNAPVAQHGIEQRIPKPKRGVWGIFFNNLQIGLIFSKL
jgi:hypothetical protein